MDETQSIESALHKTTEELSEKAANINTKEIELETKRRQLEILKEKIIQRETRLQLYIQQLSTKSESLKQEEQQYGKKLKEQEEELSQEISKNLKKIDKKIQKLKNIQKAKIENDKEINQINGKIGQYEEEMLTLEKKDLKAEKILYELTTRPFSPEEINNEIKKCDDTDIDAIRALLHLTYHQISELRQEISIEKRKRATTRNEYARMIEKVKEGDSNSLQEMLNNKYFTTNKPKDIPFYNPITGKVDTRQFKEIETRVNVLKQKENRIDKEINNINSKKPLFSHKFNEMQVSFQRIEIEKERYNAKLLDFSTSCNPEYLNSLSKKKEAIEIELEKSTTKLEKSKKKLYKLQAIENSLVHKLRSLTEIEIDIEHRSLQLQSVVNEIHQIELDNEKLSFQQEIEEQMLVSTLSDLQRLVALHSKEFDELIERHRKFEEEMIHTEQLNRASLLPTELINSTQQDETSEIGNMFQSSLIELDYENLSFKDNEQIKMKKKIERLKKLKEKVRNDSLKLLAKVRNQNENNAFQSKEIRALQGKMHQESFELYKMQTELAKEKQRKQDATIESFDRSTDKMNFIRDRMEMLRSSIVEKRGKIQAKNEILLRIERVNNINSSNGYYGPDMQRPMLLIEDSERVYDRAMERRRICQDADRKVENARKLLDGFCRLYQNIREEVRIWTKNQGNCSIYNTTVGQSINVNDKLMDWVETMKDTCFAFRDSGV